MSESETEYEHPSCVQFMDLNNDCLESILECVNDLYAEVQMARSCRRLHEIMLRIWGRRASMRTFDYQYLKQTFRDLADFDYLVKYMHDIYEQCIINSKQRNTVRDLQDDLLSIGIGSLEKVTRCTLYTEFHCTLLSDCDAMALHELFPNLAHLGVYGDIRLRYLERFKQLEDLHLCIASKPHDESLAPLFELPKLRALSIQHVKLFHNTNFFIPQSNANFRNLEKLMLNVNVLTTILREVVQLPKLRTVIFNIEGIHEQVIAHQALFALLNRKSENIIGIEIENFFLDLQPGWDHHLPHLKYTKLQDFSFECWTHSNDMWLKYTKMHRLRSIGCRHCPCLRKEVLMRFIERCPDLEYLDVRFCDTITIDWLFDAVKILERRPGKTLTINHNSIDLDINVKNEQFFFDQQKRLKLQPEIPVVYQSPFVIPNRVQINWE